VDERLNPASLTDEVLVRRCQAGDHEAFATIVDRYKYGIYWLVRRMVGERDDEDLTQEVFLRAYQAMPRFRGQSALRTWLLKIARNLCLTELRKRGRRGEHVSLDDEGEEKVHMMLPSSGAGLEAKIERRDLSRVVQDLIGKLPVQYRTVLTLYYLQDVRYEDIADIMEVPLGTVKTHLYRAKLRLRELVLAESDLADLVGEVGPGKAGDGGRST
jgi:RNA polymerase sigma-70 factor (ECF subfamily)